jgi:hypothetical protein
MTSTQVLAHHLLPRAEEVQSQPQPLGGFLELNTIHAIRVSYCDEVSQEIPFL